jgi:hypothetical protein
MRGEKKEGASGAQNQMTNNPNQKVMVIRHLIYYYPLFFLSSYSLFPIVNQFWVSKT